MLRSIVASFALRQERSPLVLRYARNTSLMILSLEYLHPRFFNISASNCHFSGDSLLDFIFTVASITENVCALKQLGLEWQNAQKHRQLCSSVNRCIGNASTEVHCTGRLSSQTGSLNGL